MRANFPLVIVAVAVIILSGVANGQPATPTVPAGLIYQAAVQIGLQPISPVSGQAIVNEKAGVNIKTIITKATPMAALSTLIGGIAGIIPGIGTAAEIALAAGYGYYNQEILPLIAAAAPNPNDIPQVLRVTDTVAPSAAACTESSMYVTPTKIKQGGVVNVAGLQVSFTIQSPQVIRNAAGSLIKKFQVVDVISCVPSTPPIIVTPQLRPQSSLAVPQMTGPYPQCWTATEDGVKYCRNMNGTIFKPDLPQGTPNVPHEGAVFRINPDGPGLAAIPVRREASAWAATIGTDNLPWVEDIVSKKTLVPSAKITVNYGWDASPMQLKPAASDPWDDPQQLAETYHAALPGLKLAVGAAPLCGPCWRALAFAQLILQDDGMAEQGFQMADDLDRPRILRLSATK